MTYKHVKHTFKNEEGHFPKTFDINYTLWFKNGVLVEIRNEFHHCVEKNSEIWSFYNS